MKLYSDDKNYKLYHGNMLDMAEVIEPNSIDAIVTDPPYELNFMNRKWDNTRIAFQKETWKKCYDVLKDGGYLLAFGGSRTFHRIACAIEDAGFEIRDTIMWLYGSGFPKSMNIGLAIDKKNGVESPIIGQNEQILKKQAKDLKNGKRKIIDSYNKGASERNNGFKTVSADIKLAQNEWQGWGTALKPSFEPIIVARKPFKGSLVDNIIENGVGGINIDECRVGNEELSYKPKGIRSGSGNYVGDNWKPNNEEIKVNGRFPANTILTYDESDFDEVCGGFPYTKSNGGSGEASKKNTLNMYNGGWEKEKCCSHLGGLGDEGSASRYFYCAKASKRDRDEGCELLEDKYLAMSNQAKAELKRENFSFQGNKESPLNSFNKVQVGKNIHPTVKPTSLMAYLIRLVTPKGGTVLDPFNGSGSTGKACMYENADRNANYKYIGIELTEEYLPISRARIEFAEKNPIMDYKDETIVKDDEMKDESENTKVSNSTIFDM